MVIGGNIGACGILPELIKNLRADYFPMVGADESMKDDGSSDDPLCTQRKLVLMDSSELSDSLWEEVAQYPEVYFLKVQEPPPVIGSRTGRLKQSLDRATWWTVRICKKRERTPPTALFFSRPGSKRRSRKCSASQINAMLSLK